MAALWCLAPGAGRRAVSILALIAWPGWAAVGPWVSGAAAGIVAGIAVVAAGAVSPQRSRARTLASSAGGEASPPGSTSRLQRASASDRYSRDAFLGRLARRTGPVVAVARGVARRRADALAARRLARELPLAIDLLGVAVGAGCTPHLAIETAARWGPDEIAACFGRVLDAARRGALFADAVQRRVGDVAVLRPLSDALIASDRLGTPLGPALERLAISARGDLRRRAEANARATPVKLLFPLVFLVLPAFALLTVVPAVLNALGRL